MRTNSSIPGVVFAPQAHQGMQRGINQLIDVVRPTLGPQPRVVAIENTFRDKTPELLDSAGLICRRIVELPDRDADMGAMMLRHVLWRVQDEIGDGTATAAVLFQAIYNGGLRYVSAGGNAMLLRHYLEQGGAAILDELERQTICVAGQTQLAQLAESLCFDGPLSTVLGEVIDIVGEHGHVDIRTGYSRDIERQYIEGIFWSGGVLSPRLLLDQTKLRTDLVDTAIFISDLEFDDPRDLVPLIEVAVQGGVRALVIVADNMSDNALTLLHSANRDPERFQVVAVHTPGLGTLEQSQTMQDLALLTGGRALIKAAGDSVRRLQMADLGRARRFWCDKTYFGIVGGKGDPRALRRHVAALRGSLDVVDEPIRRAALKQRLGKLLGGSATLLVGGTTESDITIRQDRARKTAELLRAALREGVLLGGGTALLECRARLRQMLDASDDLDARAAYRILLHALEEPIRTIATNAGYDPPEVLAQLNVAASGYGWDARNGQMVDFAEAGIYDVAAAQKRAVRTAISGAASALTIDTVVHKRKRDAAGGTP